MWTTEQELMDRINISQSTLYKMRCIDKQLKNIPTVKRNGRRVYLTQELNKWIENHKLKVKNAYISRKKVLDEYRNKNNLTSQKIKTSVNNSGV